MTMKWAFRILYTALLLALPAMALANYTATQGAGTTFGSVLVGGATHYMTMLICDFTTASQCASVTGANALKVDGSAITQPVSIGSSVAVTNAGTFATQLTGATNNINNVTGTVSLPTGAATSALQATNTATTAHTCAVAGYSELGCLGQIDDDVKGPVAAGTARIGYTSDDPCTQVTKTNAAIATAVGTTQLVAPSGSTQVYVCSLSLISAATATVNLVGGTGATCTTGTPVAALGSTTAANGMSLAANGGLTFGNGGATVVRTTTAGHGLCLIQSGTTALAGNITYVQQ